MKAALAFLLFAALAQAQDSTAVAASQAACGSKNVNFDAKADPTHHPTPQPDAGTALVYVVEDLGQCSDCDIPRIGGPVHVSGAILKVGMDGTWVGAGKGASYFFSPPRLENIISASIGNPASKAEPAPSHWPTSPPRLAKSTISVRVSSPGPPITHSIWILSIATKANTWSPRPPSASRIPRSSGVRGAPA